MPARYEVIDSAPTVQVVSATATKPVVLYTAVSTVSGAAFSAIIDQVFVDAAEFVPYVREVLEGRAVFLDELIEMPEVSYATIIQDVNEANLLQETLVVTVTSASGRSSADLPGIRFPTNLAAVQAKAVAKSHELDAIEA